MTTHLNGHVIFGAIEEKWIALGREGGQMGLPVSNEAPTFDGAGRFQEFTGGTLSWHPEIGAFAVWGLIRERWKAIGAERFGYPITDELTCPDGHGRYNHFRTMQVAGRPEASIYWTPETGAVEVYGGVRDHWARLGWETGPLRYPFAPEAPTFDGVGRNQAFQGGAICWHPETGAFSVQGLICARWREIGAERFGYPINDEGTCPDGVGKYSHFRRLQDPNKPESSIYWTPETGAVDVFGAIRSRWAAAGWETGPLRYPFAPDAPTFDGVGRHQAFQGGAISWHPELGAFQVQGLICVRWREIGAERFGYPITDESACPDGNGRYNHFRTLQDPNRPESSIYWTPETGAVEVYGAIRDRWARRGWETSNMGYPVSPEADWPEEHGGRRQQFQGGRIVWTPAMGAVFDPLVFEARIVSGGLAALGGWCRVSIDRHGRMDWSGHAHNSGMDGYEFTITAVITTPSGLAVAFRHSGDVGGTFAAGSRDDDWNEFHQNRWPVTVKDLNDGVFGTSLEYTSDLGSTFEDLALGLVKFAAGVALGPLTGVIFVGVGLGSLIATGSVTSGARIISGTLWMAGPAGMLLAIAGDGVANLGSKSRTLSYEEYDWANREVFNGSLPPRDKLHLTDTIGGGDRAFVWPNWDGNILINMGPTAYSDPRAYKGAQRGTREWGRTFIHELVHTCQVDAAANNVTFIAQGLAMKACEIAEGQEGTYGYDGPDVDFRSLNIEQQAQIVSDWYAGSPTNAKSHSMNGKDPASPYYKFITNHLWTRAF